MSKQHQQSKARTDRRIIRMKRVREKYPLSESSIYEKIKRGLFPAPFTLSEGGRARGWFEDEIDDYLEKLAVSQKGDHDE